MMVAVSEQINNGLPFGAARFSYFSKKVRLFIPFQQELPVRVACTLP
jgi:hypothetical protein